MKRKVTIKDVAELAGVSLGTVSRVLNENDSVNAEMQKKVREAMRELRYRPNAVAQSMRLNSTQAIAIVVRDTSAQAMSSFIKSAQAILFEAGYAMIITETGDKRDQELSILDSLLRRRIDGLIMTTVSDRDEELTRAREALDVPIVLLDRGASGRADTLSISYSAGTREAVCHLLELGHRRIALLTGDESVQPARERIEGYKRAFEQFGLQVDKRMIVARGFSPETAFVEATDLLNSVPRPTALISGGVAMLAPVLRAILTCGLKVPQDISLIGSLDTELAELATPPISVLDIDYAELGAVAARLILDRVRKDVEPSPPRRLTFPAKFIIRGSCRQIVGTDPAE